MNAKVIFVLSALFACACATKEFYGAFWDESTGKLNVSSTVSITQVNDHFHAALSNVNIITKEGVAAESVLPSHAWVLSEPIESVSFDFTFNPVDGTHTVTSPDGASASAQRFSNWLAQAIAESKSTEYYLAKGEKPPTREVSSFFGSCGVKNFNKVIEGEYLVLTFDTDHANCSKRNPFIASPAESDSETHRLVFHNGKHLTEISSSLNFEKNGVAHHTGGKLVEA